MRNEMEPKSPPAGALGEFGTALFALWRGLLGMISRTGRRIARLLSTSSRAWVQQWVRLVSYHRYPDLAWSDEGERLRQAAAAIGLRAFIFGIVTAAIGAVATRNSWMAAGAVGAQEVLWAAARFIIIALVAPRGSLTRPRLAAAFLAGLLPYALGVTAALRVVALAASAYLTYRGLSGAGLPRRDANIAIAWSFGGHAAMLALGWIARALIAVIAL